MILTSHESLFGGGALVSDSLCIKDRCKNKAESGMLCVQHAGENARWAREREVRATEVADRDDEAQLGDHIGEDGNPWGDD